MFQNSNKVTYVSAYNSERRINITVEVTRQESPLIQLVPNSVANRRGIPIQQAIRQHQSVFQ